MSRSRFPDGRTGLLGIVGSPLEHSRSPELHSAVLRELDRNLLYVPVPVSAARLRSFLGLASELGFLGLNITTPYKEKAFGCVEALDDETHRTRMVNTVLFDAASSARGTGTDGAGVVRWLQLIGAVRGPIGVLGFGPTARSIVHRAWMESLPVELVLTRRPRAVRGTLSKWRRDARELPGPGPNVLGWEELESTPRSRARGGQSPSGGGAQGGHASSEISARNALSSTEEGIRAIRAWISVLPTGVPIPVRFWERIDLESIVLDMNYGKGRDDQCTAARSRGHRAADGLGPLLEQAALSLSLWLREVVPVELFHRAAGTSPERLGPR